MNPPSHFSLSQLLSETKSLFSPLSSIRKTCSLSLPLDIKQRLLFLLFLLLLLQSKEENELSVSAAILHLFGQKHAAAAALAHSTENDRSLSLLSFLLRTNHHLLLLLLFVLYVISTFLLQPLSNSSFHLAREEKKSSTFPPFVQELNCLFNITWI